MVLSVWGNVAINSGGYEKDPDVYKRQVDTGMLVEELRVGLDGDLLIGTKIRLIVIEIDVFHGRTEEIFVRGRRGGNWRRRLGDGETRSGVLRSARAFGRQVIGGGISRGDLLRPAGLHRADAVDGNVSGVGRLPT